MTQLTLLFKRGYNGMETVRDFPSNDESIAFSYRQIGLLQRWQVTIRLEREMLTEEQMQWIMLNLDGLLVKAALETKSIGLIGKVMGRFHLVMRAR